MMEQVIKIRKLKKKRVHDQRRANLRLQDERTWDDADDTAGESGSFCSKKTKETLLQLKNLKLLKKDPYNHNSNKILEEFHERVVCSSFNEKFQRSGGSFDASIEAGFNLAEDGLLLHALTNSIYVSQVNDVHDQILNLVAYVTKTQPPEKKSRGRKKKVEESGPNNEVVVDGVIVENGVPVVENGVPVVENGVENAEGVIDINSEKTAEGIENDKSDELVANGDGENVTQNNLNENGDLQIEGNPAETLIEQANNGSNCDIGNEQNGFIGPINQETVAESNGCENILQDSNPSNATEAGLLPESENNNNVEDSLNTQEKGNENEEPLSKKSKKERQPPTLISCLDFEPIIIDSEDDFRWLKMPELIAHYLENAKNPRAKRRTKEELEKLKAEREARMKNLILEMDGLNDLNTDLINIDGEDSIANLLESNNDLPEPEPINVTTEESEELNPFIQIGTLLNDFTNFEAIKTDSGVTTEDQFEMQKNFTQLQRLLISKEKPTRKKDVDNIFQMIFGRISNICKKYNMDIKRNDKEVAAVETDTASTIVKKASQSEDIVENSLKTVNGVHENFTNTILGISQMLPDLIQPSDKMTIFERTSEKSMLESKAKCEDMIRRVQHNIVRHFKDWHMIMEHSPEFIHRVHSFESKMKKLLEKEEKKAEFDISKYEKEVLQTTLNVCEDVFERTELESEFEVASPMSNLEHDEQQHGLINNVMDIDGNASIPFQASSGDLDRPSSTTSSGGLNKWIALSDVFAELNTSNNVEAARCFYAVLALLSFQNLDMNYDPLMSVELDLANKLPSTPTLSQASSVSSTSSSSQEFSRGLKIMASRCPKVDTEEVFISPLCNKSRTEEFRIAQQKNDTPTNGDDHNTSIADEFTEVKMIQYFGDLFGKKRKRMSKKRKLDSSN